MFKHHKPNSTQGHSRSRANSDFSVPEQLPQYLHSLHYLEPNPILPPSYKTSNPNPTIRYPVFELERNALIEDKLPEYSPAVNAVTLVMRKVELLSPYEVCTNRNWRNLVMEINSTQLNFYSIDDLPFLDKVVNHNKKKGVYEFTEFEQHLILESITKKRELYLTPRRIISSYSLQMARFGLPVDYVKKNYCLRVRLESEQMLLKFVSLNDLLSWSNNLSIGINVSLDLSQRELPKDKTVPRRRRRHSRRRRERANSGPDLIAPVTSADVNGDGSMNAARRSSVAGTTSRTIIRELNNKSMKTKLFGKLFKSRSSGSSSSSSSSSSSVAVASTPHNHGPMDIDQLTRSLVEANLNSYEMDQHTTNNAVADTDENEEIENDELLTTNRLRRGSSSTDALDDYESDAESLVGSSNASSEGDLKTWKPSYKENTQKKIYKDSLRCLNLMTHSDNWIGKSVIRFDKGLYCNVDTRALRNKKLKEFIVGPRGFIPVA